MPLRAFRPEVPEQLERAVSRCLAKRREERFPALHDLARKIAEFGTSRARHALGVVELTRAPAATAVTSLTTEERWTSPGIEETTETALATARPRTEPPGRTMARRVAALLIAVVAAAGAVRLLLEHESAEPVSPSTVRIAPIPSPADHAVRASANRGREAAAFDAAPSRVVDPSLPRESAQREAPKRAPTAASAPRSAAERLWPSQPALPAPRPDPRPAATRNDADDEAVYVERQ